MDEVSYGGKFDRLNGLRSFQRKSGGSDQASVIFSPGSGLLAGEEEIDETEDEDEGEGEPMVEESGAFVFSILGFCTRRTLHRVGEWWRVPGVHYTGTTFQQVRTAPRWLPAIESAGTVSRGT